MNKRASSLFSRKPKFFYGYVIAIAAFLVLVLTSGTLYTFGVFVKPLIDEFGWSRELTAGAYSAEILVLGIFFAVTGRLNDRFGPRRVLTVCGVILGAGYMLVSLVGAVWQLYLFYGLVLAIGQSGGLIPLMSTVARWFVRKRGLMSGIVISGVGVGQIIIPLLATHLISVYGWRMTFIIIGIICIVGIVLLAQLLKRDPGQIGLLPDGDHEVQQESQLTKAAGLSRNEAVRTRQFWIITGIYICYGMIVQGTIVHIVPHATDMGIASVAAASIVSFIGGASIGGRIGMGIAGDRIGSRRALIYIFSLAIAASICIQFAGELWMLYIFAIIFGFSYGGMVSLESPLVANFFGMKAHGALLGLVHFGATVGGAVSPILAGRIFDTTRSYQIAFLIVTCFSVAALVLVLVLKPLRELPRNSLAERTTFKR